MSKDQGAQPTGQDRPERENPLRQEPRGGGCDSDQAERLARLKSEIKAGTYRADLKDIAKQLARAMEPME